VSSQPPSGTSASAPAAGLIAPGQLLAGRYRLEQALASGGMAQVWRATDEVLRRGVAVKLLHPHLAADDTFVARFRQEAVAAARLAHPGIVSIFDTCSHDGVEAIVMELLPGRTLRDRLDDTQPLDPWQVAGMAAQVADALDAAHQAGLVHRDIKPANILLAGEGRVKVADFGIAKAVAESDLTQPGLMVGTAKYVAPEQVEGAPVDARTDIYSLGVVLYEALCGRPPFVGDTDAATALSRLHREPLRCRQVRPGVPRELEAVVERAMARRPDDRYGSATELRAALLAAGAGDATTVVDPTDHSDATMADAPVAAGAPQLPTAPPAPAPSFVASERSWLVPTLLVVLVAVALGVAGLLIGGSGAGTLIDDVRGAFTGGEGGAPAGQLQIVSATAADPFGDGWENDEDAPNVYDGDLGTTWATEGYNDRDIARFKGGVGIAIELEQRAALGELVVTSTTENWRAQVFVADQVDVTGLEAWGEPVFTTQGIASGPARIDLKGAEGSAVLIWIIDRGDAPQGERGRVEIADVVVRSR
jgi:eukaryotic-like serine/threonine-protein kinase